MRSAPAGRTRTWARAGGRSPTERRASCGPRELPDDGPTGGFFRDARADPVVTRGSSAASATSTIALADHDDHGRRRPPSPAGRGSSRCRSRTGSAGRGRGSRTPPRPGRRSRSASAHTRRPATTRAASATGSAWRSAIRRGASPFARRRAHVVLGEHLRERRAHHPQRHRRPAAARPRSTARTTRAATAPDHPRARAYVFGETRNTGTGASTDGANSRIAIIADDVDGRAHEHRRAHLQRPRDATSAAAARRPRRRRCPATSPTTTEPTNSARSAGSALASIVATDPNGRCVEKPKSQCRKTRSR